MELFTQPLKKKKSASFSTKILGHRGARNEILENSKEGFIYAQSLIQYGLAGIEFDIQLTTDGKLLVFHDDTISRLFNQQGQINQLPVNFFHKNLIWNNGHTHQVISLDNMPTLLKGYHHIELEIKTHSRTNYRELISVLEVYLSEFPNNLPICLTSFDSKFLALMQSSKTLCNYNRGLLVEKAISEKDLIYQTKKLNCSQVGIYAKLITPELVKHCHLHNIAVTAWTVNDFNQAICLLDMSVDWIITDIPKTFLLSNLSEHKS